MSAKTLRVHIQNPPGPAGELTLSPARLAAAIAEKPALAGRIEITEASGDGIPEDLAGAEVLFMGTKFSLAEARRRAPALRWVQSTFAGVESLLKDMPADMQLANASGVHADKGGEFVLAAALMLSYRLPELAVEQAAQRWTPIFEPTLKTRRITILGVGAIGGGAAKALRAQGCKVTGITRSGTASAELDRVADLSQLDAILAETDILVSTLPNTPETAGLIDRRRVDLLPQGAGIVVVGRAAVLDYDAIMDRLDAGTLGGAVLDVFPVEPIPANDRIWTTPRLIVSPHCSVDDHSVYLDKCLEIFLENLERDLAGQPLINIVDPARGY
jgi:phosphoglycerate dehydrogenase-like enzyme